jgi:hypothetical protein
LRCPGACRGTWRDRGSSSLGRGSHHHAHLAPLAAYELLHLLGEDGVGGVGLGVVLELLGVEEQGFAPFFRLAVGVISALYPGEDSLNTRSARGDGKWSEVCST